MATDNFLDKKSVLGLAERVPMCPPPETIVFSDSIQWLGHSLTNGNQREYNDNISSSLVTNHVLVSNLALGQSVACQIKINGKVEILPLFLAERLTTQSGTIQTIKSIAKGANVLDDGHIAGVIFTHTKTITRPTTGLPMIAVLLSCYIYIHYWGTI